jgi:hypothetical protein
MSQVITEEIVLADTITERFSFGATSTQVSGTVGVAAPTSLYSWVNGTTANAVDLRFEHSYTLAASASTTLTLSALTDDLGRAVAFARVRKLIVYVTAKTGSDFLTVGNAALHPWTAIVGGTTQTIPVRDLLLLVGAGTTAYVVTSGSSDQLKILNSGSASITFTVAISGASA